MKKPENLWKATAQAAIIGLAGAAAMFATEMLLFPGFVRATPTTTPVDSCGQSTPCDLEQPN